MAPPLVRPLIRCPVALLLALLLAACGGDATDAVSPSIPSPSALLSDGSRPGGNPNFFFLPPLVANPSGDADYSANQFVGGWRPVVQVCKLTTAATPTCAGPWLRTWLSPAVQAAGDHYAVTIDTREAWALPGLYRVRVALLLPDTTELGFADVQLYDSPQVRNTITGDIIPLSDGRTLPFKFRIEQGVAVTSTNDFVEATVPASGGVIVTSEGGAGMYFAPGWLPTGMSSTVVTIERRAVGLANDCHNGGIGIPSVHQYEGCYNVETYPAVGIVQAEVIVGVCNENPTYDPQLLYKSDPLPAGGRRIKALQNVALPMALASLLECDDFAGTPGPELGFTGASGARALFASGASWLMNGMGRLLTPQSAYAIDAGSGGRMAPALDDLSDFGWGVPMSVAARTGAGQSGAPGATLPVAMTVRAFGTHTHDGDTTWLPNVPVTFTATSGGFYNAGTETVDATRILITDLNGYASAPLTMPSGFTTAPPPNVTVTATIPDDASNNPGVVPSVRTVSFVATLTAPPAPVADAIEVLYTGVFSTVPPPLASPASVLLGSTVGFAAVVSQTSPYVNLSSTAVCTWTSSNPTVVTVTAGSPTTTASLVAVALGSVTMTVTCNGVNRTYTIGVYNIG